MLGKREAGWLRIYSIYKVSDIVRYIVKIRKTYWKKQLFPYLFLYKLPYIIIGIFISAVQSAWSSSSEELMRSIKAKILENYLQKQEMLKRTEVICPGYRDEFDVI